MPGTPLTLPSRSAAGLALLLMAASAQAGRPFSTEDAGVLEAGQCEWQSIGARTRADASHHEHGLSSELACGSPWATQVAIGVATAVVDSEHSRHVDLTGKTAIIGDGGDDRSSVAVAYGVGATSADANARAHLDFAFMNLALTRPLAAGWTLHANAGWAQDRTERGPTHAWTTWAVALSKDFSDELSWGIECLGDDHGGREYGTGVLWNATESLSLTAAYASTDGQPRATTWSVSAKYAF